MQTVSTHSTEDSPIDLWRLGAIVGLIGVVGWFVFLLFSPPRIPSGDLICFKDPGINLAHGLGLVERISPTNPTITPQFHSNYPPLFPVLYGLYVSVFGADPKSDEMFDFFWTASASLIFWFFVTPRYGDKRTLTSSMTLMALLLLILPIGPFWTQRERPDTLGFAVMLASLSMLRRKLTTANIFLTSLIAGINFLISPYAFVTTCIVLTWLLLAGENGFSLRDFRGARFLKMVTAAVLGLAIPVVVFFLIFWMNDPNAITRFASNVSGKSTQGQAGVGYFSSLLSGDFNHFFSAFTRYDSIRYKWMLAYLVTTIFVTTTSLFIRTHRSFGRVLWQALALLSVGTFPLLFFPYQPVYMSWTATIMLVLWTRFQRTNQAQNKEQTGWILAGTFGMMVLVAFPYMVREFFIAYKSQPAYNEIRQIIKNIPATENQVPLVVATYPSTYFFFKQAGFVVVDIAYLARPAEIAKVDLFILHPVETGTPPSFPKGWNATRFEPVFVPTIDSKTNLFGKTIYNRKSTWEVEIYRQRK